MSKYTEHWPKVDPRRRTDAALNQKISSFLSALAIRKLNREFPLPPDPYEYLKKD